MKRLLENIKIAFQSLNINKLRSFLTMLGIIIGVGAVVAMMSVGVSAQQTVVQSIQNIGSNLIIISPGNIEEERGDIGAVIGTVVRDELKMEDAEAIKRESTLIEDVAPVIVGSSVVSYMNKNIQVSVYASTDSAEKVYNFEIAEGRFYNSSDVANSANVAILGQTVVKKLFGRMDPIGKTIKIDGKNFVVIGTNKPMGATQFGVDQDKIISVPVTTAQNKLYGFNYVNLILAKAKSEDAMDEASREITKILQRQHKIRPGEPNDFTVQNQTQILDTLSIITTVFTITISSIAGISLLVGGIGIMNIMLVSVMERTREIGIRKAVGAKNKDILVQFLTESIVLSITGGILGIIFAVAVSLTLSKFTMLQTTVSAMPIILALTFSTMVGLFFGIYPAMRAARLNPIDALRYE
ncbi:MAG: ABC transporter permease [Actinobacteria bacterium]|nr:ABC transporter permease [Actinomycetota bacterium]